MPIDLIKIAKCTIIIPTYNRPSYMRRILDYYASFGESFDIIVADSSSEENKRLNKDAISSVSNLDIKYLDHYSSKINPYHKIDDALNYIKTEYCVFCADDDFITPNGIKKSVDFLGKNPDFTVAQGRYIGFRITNGKRKKKRFHCEFASDRFLSIEFSDPEARLEYHLSNYFTSTFYGVHRTDFVNMIFGETVKFTNNVYFAELLPSMLTLIYGKMKCLDVLYAARNMDSIHVYDYGPTLRDAIEAGTFDEKYVKFRDCLAGHLSKNSRLGIEESGKLVDKAMSAYLKKVNCVVDTDNTEKSVSAPESKKRILLDSLHLPDWMDKGITTSYNALFNKPVSMPPEYHNDFNKIRLQVLYHSRTAYTETAKLSIRS